MLEDERKIKASATSKYTFLFYSLLDTDRIVQECPCFR